MYIYIYIYISGIKKNQNSHRVTWFFKNVQEKKRFKKLCCLFSMICQIHSLIFYFKLCYQNEYFCVQFLHRNNCKIKFKKNH